MRPHKGQPNVIPYSSSTNYDWLKLQGGATAVVVIYSVFGYLLCTADSQPLGPER